MLVDLRELAVCAGNVNVFNARITRFAMNTICKPALMARMGKTGLAGGG